MTYIHDTVIREYLSGKLIQVKRKDMSEWEDIPKYGTSDSIPMFFKTLEYRVKPEFRYFFCHFLSGSNTSKEDVFKSEVYFTEFPKYWPYGAHIMIKVCEGKIIETRHSETDEPAYSHAEISQ